MNTHVKGNAVAGRQHRTGLDLHRFPGSEQQSDDSKCRRMTSAGLHGDLRGELRQGNAIGEAWTGRPVEEAAWPPQCDTGDYSR
jgi:hypothetical protein